MSAEPTIVKETRMPSLAEGQRFPRGTDAFQEVDTVGITRPCVKHNYLVRDVRDLAAIVHEAFHLARTGRPGPVVIDIPKDVSADQTHYSRLEKISFPCSERNSTPNPADVERAASAILNAQRPVLYVGGGIVSSGACAELIDFAEQLQLPVTPPLMGLGGFPSAHPLSLGMLGMHGTYTANMAVADSDLLIALGVRFDDRVTGKLATFAPQAKVIHVDIDPANVGKNRAPDLSMVADAREALAALHTEVESSGPKEIDQSIQRRTRWWEQLRAWQREQPMPFSGSRDQIKPQHVIRELHRLTNGEAILVTDVGQHQMWAAQFYPFKRARQWITTGGLREHRVS